MRLAAILIASVLVVGGVAVGSWRLWPSPTEVVDSTDCGGWNTRGFFRNVTAREVSHCLEMGADIRDRSPDGITPLLWAALETRNPDVVAALLSAGAEVNERLEIKGEVGTPLLVAADGREAGVIGVLLEAGADESFRGPRGQTALHLAARGGNWEGVSLLLEHGAQADTVDDDGQTPLQAVGKRFARGWDHHGRIANEIRTIRAFLEHGSHAATLAEYGWTEMHTAALTGNDASELAALVGRGLDPNAETSSGWRVVHLAAFGNEDPAIMSSLLALGADPNALIGDTRTVDLRRMLSRNRHPNPDEARAGDGRTALHCAAFANPNPLVVATLLEGGADPNVRTTIGWTPLHAAAYANPNPDVVVALLEGGAHRNPRIKETWTTREVFPNSVGALDEDREEMDSLSTLDGRMVSANGLSTPLHVAANHPREPSLVAALVAGGADPNARDADGETPLHHVETVADVLVLTEADADPNARNEDGETPLFGAVRQAALSGNLDLLSALIDRGAATNVRSKSGWTPLHNAASGTAPSSYFRAAGPEADTKLVSLLIRGGASSDSPDDYGNTPLHVAANSGVAPSTVDALIGGGADPNSRNAQGRTPLHNAAAPAFNAPSNGVVISRLLDAGANPNLRDETGATPLHRALVRLPVPSVVDALLDGGANAALVDGDGVTPWDMAQRHEGFKGTKAYWRLNDARFD